MQVIDYLSGRFVELEDRHIYAKLWYDEATGMVGSRGKMARVLYMTNVGTIPDEAKVQVKVGSQIVGYIDEAFLERLKRGDVFVLGGDKYEFLYARGMTVQVNASVYRPPTIPSWFSDMLPLSFDLAMEINRFRRLMEDRFMHNESRADIVAFINSYLYVDDNGSSAIYSYFREQFMYAKIPHDRRLLVEHYDDGRSKHVIFHSLYGRRVNDCLARSVAYAVSRLDNRDVEMGVADNGFYLTSTKAVNVVKAFKILKANKLDLVLGLAIEKTEVLSRRFRHCATRALMILRNYRGRTKRVGRQQLSSQILINAVRRIDPNFSILREAKREVLEDLMDIENAKVVVDGIQTGRVEVEEIHTTVPSPFAFGLVLSGYTDLLRMEDKVAFLKRMHSMVIAKIYLAKGKRSNLSEDELSGLSFDYHELWKGKDGLGVGAEEKGINSRGLARGKAVEIEEAGKKGVKKKVGKKAGLKKK